MLALASYSIVSRPLKGDRVRKHGNIVTGIASFAASRTVKRRVCGLEMPYPKNRAPPVCGGSPGRPADRARHVMSAETTAGQTIHNIDVEDRIRAR